MENCYSYLACAAVTDQGRKRKNNEDAYGVYSQHGVFCVADGMGGAEDGEIASQAAVEAVATMLQQFRPEQPLALAAMQAWLARSMNEVSAWIYNRSEERGSRGTGTTFVGVCCDPEKPGSMLALHAGDSRAYRIRKREITQITGDHSAAALAGVRDERELNPMFRGMVMRAVGVQATVELERTPFDAAEGDFVLLCSDGLTRMVEDKAICDIVRKAKAVEAAAQALVEAANRNGGADNVTVVLIRVGALPAPVAALAPECPVARTEGVDGEKDSNTHATSGNETNTDSTRNFGRGSVTPNTPTPEPSACGGATADADAGEPDLSEAKTLVPEPLPPCPEDAKGKGQPAKNIKGGLFVASGTAIGILLGAFVLVGPVNWMGRHRSALPSVSSAVPGTPTNAAAAKEVAAGQARLAAEQAAEQAAREREEQRKAAEARLAQAKADAARAEAERLAREKAEQARLAAERAAREREEQRKAAEARLAQAKADAARAEAERLAREKAEQARLAAERAAREREEQRKAAEARLAQAKADAARAEAERLAREKAGEPKPNAIARLVELARNEKTLTDYCKLVTHNDREDSGGLVKGVGDSAQKLARWADQQDQPKKFELSATDAAGHEAVEEFVGALAYVVNDDNIDALILDTDSQIQQLEMLGRTGSVLDRATKKKAQFEKIKEEVGKLKNLKEDVDRLRLISLVKWIGGSVDD